MYKVVTATVELPDTIIGNNNMLTEFTAFAV